MAEVDRVLGNDDKMRGGAWRATAAAFDAGTRQARGHRHHDREGDGAASPRRLPSGLPRAFVQVQNGCDHRCTFCIIPFGRGNSRSVPMGAVVEQVRRLVARGHAEIVLTGVDLTSYGGDLPAAPKLGGLVKQILRHVPELKRLRMSSIDSIEADSDLLDAIAGERAADAASPSVAAGGRRPHPEADEAPARAAPTRSGFAARCGGCARTLRSAPI